MYEYNNYALTEDEKLAGLGLLLSNNEYEYYDNKSKINDENKKDKLNNLRKNIKYRDNILKDIINVHFDNLVMKYVLSECLPNDYKNIALQVDGLKIFLKAFVKQQCKLLIDDKLLIEIDEFIGMIYINLNNEIVYTRVNEIQHYLHNKFNEKNGKNSHYNLDKILMKNLLSAIRLHLNIYDLRNKDIETLIQIRNKTKNEIQLEYKNPSKNSLIQNQKFIPIWKAKKMKTLIDFMSPNFIGKFNSIINSNLNLSQYDYEELIDSLY